MLTKPIIWGAVLAYYLSFSFLYAADHSSLIIETSEHMGVEKVGAFFDDYPDVDKLITENWS